jgi:pimeloyl-ACP methyl ester carboxylesterase
MKNFFLLCSLLIGCAAMAKTTVYLFPGEGSDERIFSKISFDTNYRVVHVELPTPDSGASMQTYAKAISAQIDTSESFIFIGVSFGGMICSELADYMKPEKIIIISSAKCRSELPHRYRFQRIVPLNKLVPEKLVKSGARFLQPIVEPDRELHAEIFNSMLAGKSPTYYKRTVNLILNWKREKPHSNIIHIHGTNDHTLPIRNIKADYVIEGGSHMMTLTRGEEIDKLIHQILGR